MVHFQEGFVIYSLSTPFSETDLEEGMGGARSFFLQSLVFFVIILKNYKQC